MELLSQPLNRNTLNDLERSRRQPLTVKPLLRALIRVDIQAVGACSTASD